MFFWMVVSIFAVPVFIVWSLRPLTRAESIPMFSLIGLATTLCVCTAFMVKAIKEHSCITPGSTPVATLSSRQTRNVKRREQRRRAMKGQRP